MCLENATCQLSEQLLKFIWPRRKSARHWRKLIFTRDVCYLSIKCILAMCQGIIYRVIGGSIPGGYAACCDFGRTGGKVEVSWTSLILNFGVPSDFLGVIYGRMAVSGGPCCPVRTYVTSYVNATRPDSSDLDHNDRGVDFQYPHPYTGVRCAISHR